MVCKKETETTVNPLTSEQTA